MQIHALQTLSFPPFMHDALSVVIVGIVVLAGLAFITLGVLQPGMLTALGGHHGDPRGGYVEFGQAAAPPISDPSPPRASSLELSPDPQTVARPHRWPDLPERAVSHSAPVRAVISWTVFR